MSTPQISSSDPALQGVLQRLNEFGTYGYRPSLPGNAIFCAVWAICAIVLAYQSIRYRRWWLLATLGLGSIFECAGNGLRIYGHFHTRVVNAYIAQEVILVLTPAFFAAAHFTILTKICQLSNPSFISPIKPTCLIPFFVVLDVISLAVQGAGSALSATSEIDGDTVSTINSHGQIVTAGLCIQVAGYVAFNIIFLLFISRARNSPGEGNSRFSIGSNSTKKFLLATWISALLVLGRSIFRTAEMAKGWIGEVATTEWYYLVFDATLVALAVVVLIIVSPTKFLPRPEDATKTTGHSNDHLEAQNLEADRTTLVASNGNEMEKDAFR
ncbi:hypothetical protein CBS101457_002835 [Exobasidium rhododendri]|nr:hypothetical protein CBS101457_002835 [Exobasidium rhododendri]